MTTDNPAATRLIEQLSLEPHPEGGFYRETYRCTEHVTRSRVDQKGVVRSASAAIYYLLCDGAWSAWHRLQSDELWHFYCGDPLFVYALDINGRLTTHCLGGAADVSSRAYQAVVPAGTWLAAESRGAQGFALVGCTVAPGFEFIDFELGDTSSLLERYPQHRSLITRLAPVSGESDGQCTSGGAGMSRPLEG